MARKLALVLAACLGVLHSAAFGLGLGAMSVDSSLNQPFSATIELRNTERLDRNEILANLASPEDFERIGVERFFFLSDLSFTTDLSDPARPLIRVSSNQPVTEPFVNFVVEVLWPSGRLLKEFTILLDPPTYAARPIAAPRAPTAPGPGRVRTPAPASQSAPASTPAPAPSATGTLSGDSYGVTDRDDTLWAIALEVRPSRDVSVHQTMLALLRLNPQAFIGQNINQLKAGYVLRVPSLDEIQRLSYQDAIVQVAEQNERWRAGLDRAPLDARGNVAEARTPDANGGALRLVSSSETANPSRSNGSTARGSGAASSTSGSAGAPGSSASRAAAGSQAAAGEQRQAALLRAELEANEAEVEALQRQLEVRDEQIARLQDAVRQQLEAQSEAQSAPASRSTAATGGVFGLSWLLIGAIVVGLLVLGFVALLVLRRMSAAGGSDAVDFNDTVVEADARQTQPMSALAPEDEDVAEEVPETVAAASGGEGDDVIAEADVYMAYGNFSEAAAALRTALEAEPQRADIRLKLLEVHVEQGDVDAFNEQAFALQGLADDATIAEADRLAARLPGAATSRGEIVSGDAKPSRDVAAGEVSLDFDLDVDGGTPSDSTPAPDLESLDIDLDLGGAGTDDAGGIDFDLDLEGEGADRGDELALDVAGDEPSDAEDALDFGDGDELGLDLTGDDDLALDIDGDDLSLDVAGDEAAPGTSIEDFQIALEGEEDDALPDIDFDLAEDASIEAAAGASGAAASVDAAALALASEDDGIDLDFDGLTEAPGEEKGEIVGMTSESAPEFANRTVILGGDELEDALETSEDDPDAPAGHGRAPAGDGDAPAGNAEAGDAEALDFDIDELAAPAGVDEASLPVETAASTDADAFPIFGTDAAAGSSADAGADGDLDAAADASALEDLLGENGAEGDEIDFELDEDFDFGDEDEADEITTKLELARAYVDMGDDEGAREILDEVARDGDDGQKRVADELLEQIG